MGTNNTVFKTNEQYLSELEEGKISVLNVHNTPYADLYILYDSREVDYSYKDEDGDWIHSTRTVVDRKALLTKCNGKYSFLIENWFDDIDNFESGLYAKVRLGQLYNLISPLGEYLFPNWFGDIEVLGNNLIFCYSLEPTLNYWAMNVNKEKPKCCIYNKRGHLLFENVIVKTPFVNGRLIIFKDDLFNYIDANGNLVGKEWFIDAQTYEKTNDGFFCFREKQKWMGCVRPKRRICFSSMFFFYYKGRRIYCSTYYSFG